MTDGYKPMNRVIIIGGGISGLATAYFLQERSRREGGPLQCVLLERAPRFGGVIYTEKVGSFVIEAGPDSFLTQKPWGLELCRQLGLSDQLISSNDGQRKTYVWSEGRLMELPEGFMMMVPTKIGPFVRTPLISWPGKIRMAMDWMLPAHVPASDESVASFVRRRLGREALEKIAEPLIGGIYGGDVERLSLKSTLPFLLDLEGKYGSVIRGILRRPAPPASPSGKPPSLFTTLRGGLFDMVRALVSRLDSVEQRPGCAARALLRPDSAGPGAFGVRLDDGTDLYADAVVAATPAPQTAALLDAVNPAAAVLLRQLPYTSSVTLSLAFAKRDLPRVPEGFGFLIPHVAQRALIACTWTSNKFPHRADADHVLVRGFAGGAHNPQVVDRDDDTLVALVRDELRVLAGITAPPLFARVFRWRAAMPQYPVGYADLLAQMRKHLVDTPGLFLAGNAFAGVGIPDCIHTGAQTAERVLEYLNGKRA